MEWMSSVCSLRSHAKKTTASTTNQNSVVTAYGMPSTRCMVSATPVPAVAMASARNQYGIAA